MYTYGIKRGIVRKLILYLLIFSSFVTLILTSIQLRLEYNRDIGQIKSQMKIIEKTHVETISTALWSFDEEVLTVELDGIIQLPDIQYLEIRPTIGQVLTAGTFEQSNIIREDFDIAFVHDEKEVRVGTLVVHASLRGVYQRLINRVAIILLSQSIKTFLVSLFIFTIFHFIVTRHLNTVVDYLSKFNLYRLNDKLTLNRKQKRKSESKGDEFDKLTSGINLMRTKLRDQSR